jgi:hypothetical protein
MRIRLQKEQAASPKQLWKIGELAKYMEKTRVEILDRFLPEHGLIENEEGEPIEWNFTKYDASELIRELLYRLEQKGVELWKIPD